MVLAATTAVGVALHRRLPDAGGAGSLVETFLPWTAVVLLGLGVLAVVRRTVVGGMAVLFGAGAWLWVCWPFTAATATGVPDLVVVQHNVSDTNADVRGTAEVLLDADPDVVTLVEVTPRLADAFTAALGESLPHHAVQGTVGVWSRTAVTDAEPVDLRPEGVDGSWDRGLRVRVRVAGLPELRVYAVHLPSVRPGSGGLDVGARDRSLRLLGDVLAADDAEHVVVGGDFNTVLADRAFAPVLDQVAAPAGSFDFTFPAVLPVVRIDHVLSRGVETTRVATLGRTSSDHRPVVADVSLTD